MEHTRLIWAEEPPTAQRRLSVQIMSEAPWGPAAHVITNTSGHLGQNPSSALLSFKPAGEVIRGGNIKPSTLPLWRQSHLTSRHWTSQLNGLEYKINKTDNAFETTYLETDCVLVLKILEMLFLFFVEIYICHSEAHNTNCKVGLPSPEEHY